jgi:nucleotidyltransferase substrate binding protein (TIGR01987 family)
MENKDIRWIQRFHNYRKALARLSNAIEKYGKEVSDEVIRAGMIKFFEMTYELAWKTLQDLLRDRQRPNSNGGPSVIITQAIADGYITDGEGWKKMKKSREMTSHQYSEETAEEIADSIVSTYFPLLRQLETRLQLEKIQQEKQS